MCSRLISFCSALLVTCFFILSSGTFQIDASADSYPIQLTAAQTLALYGSNISGLWYNGNTTQYVDFEFYKSTKQIYNSFLNTFGSLPISSSVSSPENLFGVKFNSTAPQWSCKIKDTNLSDLSPRWFASQNVQREEVASYEFLIYKCEFSPSKIKDSEFDFQLNFNLSLVLQNVERFRSIYGFSSGTMSSLSSRGSGGQSVYQSQLDFYTASDSINPFYTTSNWRYGGSDNNFNVAHHPINNIFDGSTSTSELTQSDYELCAYPCPNFALHAIDTDLLQTPVDLSSFVFNIRGAQSCVLHVNGSELATEFTPATVYLMIMCPIVWGNITPPQPEETTPNYSDQIQNIEVGVGDININLDETNNRLDLILDKLDDIYENMGVSVEGVDLTEQGPLSWIGTHIDNLGTSIVNGVRGLFIPSQADLINFRLNLQSDFQTHFPAFFTADDKVHNLYSIFENSVTPRSSITVPTVSMTVSDVANNQNANFSFGGYEVPLKPNQDRLGILYDSLAFIIDAIATLGIINMLRSKIRKIFSGGNTD